MTKVRIGVEKEKNRMESNIITKKLKDILIINSKLEEAYYCSIKIKFKDKDNIIKNIIAIPRNVYYDRLEWSEYNFEDINGWENLATEMGVLERRARFLSDLNSIAFSGKFPVENFKNLEEAIKNSKKREKNTGK